MPRRAAGLRRGIKERNAGVEKKGEGRSRAEEGK